MHPTRQKHRDALIKARAEWLEDVLAGLLAAGCTKDQIEVQEHPVSRTVVCVNGEPKYEWKFTP